MSGYLFSRIVQLPITLLGLFTLIFIMLRVMPGDPVATYLGDVATPQAILEMKAKFGLDKPLPAQYVEALGGLCTGNLGNSFSSGRQVVTEIMSVLPHTVFLAVAALIISSVLGIIAGVLAALRLNRAMDYIVMSLSILGASVPVFWLSLILILIFSYKLGLFPVAGVSVHPSLWPQLHALVLPATALGFLFMALVARMTRSSMAEILQADFIRTVRAKGASERLIIVKHALRNAMIPIITVIGLNTGLLFSGAVLTETVFARPGIGKLLVGAVLVGDYPLVQGVILLIGLIYVLSNLTVDLLYAYLDPRIKYG